MSKTQDNSANSSSPDVGEAASASSTAGTKAGTTAGTTADGSIDKESAQQQDNQLQANALELLLRSPRINIDTILRLLDIDEYEFRALVKVNPALGGLLKQRSQGLLELPGTKPRKCPMCREWFLPYAGDRLCSDECKAAYRIDRRDFREESRATASD